MTTTPTRDSSATRPAPLPPSPRIANELDARLFLLRVERLLDGATPERRREFNWRAALGDWDSPDGDVRECVLGVLALRAFDASQGRVGRWFPTYSGKRYFPLDPRPGDIDLADIAHSLARLPRFNAHLYGPYTVGQHSVLMSRYVPEDIALLALLHDAPEAYLSDVASPVKAILGDAYASLEARAWSAISRAFSVGDTEEQWATLRRWDLAFLHTEARDLFPLGYVADGVNWGGETVPDLDILRAHGVWDADTCEERFLQRFDELRPCHAGPF